MTVDRRKASRERDPKQPHPREIKVALDAWKFYGQGQGFSVVDAVRRMLVAAAIERGKLAEEEAAKLADDKRWRELAAGEDRCSIHDSDTDPGTGRP